ncbi:MAG: hypothetical protein P0116_09895 [Candidatus Nitrosocosmicus sp.]|nr:hypothetical protein [Candidatus Nitrosocosmicus sp.]
MIKRSVSNVIHGCNKALKPKKGKMAGLLIAGIALIVAGAILVILEVYMEENHFLFMVL